MIPRSNIHLPQEWDSGSIIPPSQCQDTSKLSVSRTGASYANTSTEWGSSTRRRIVDIPGSRGTQHTPRQYQAWHSTYQARHRLVSTGYRTADTGHSIASA
eukprot:2007821-Rhodomonas_salina.4